MRTRFWLYLLFGAFALIPMLIAGMILISGRSEQALQEAAANNQAIAENHARTIANAYQGVLLSFQKRLDTELARDGGLQAGSLIDSHHNAMDSLRVISPAAPSSAEEASAIPAAALMAMQRDPAMQWPKTTDLLANGRGGQSLYIYRHVGDMIIAAELWSAVLVDTAAIGQRNLLVYDRNGALLNTRAGTRSISDQIPVAAATSGFAPPLRQASVVRTSESGEFVSGFATIAAAGWGVAVSQPAENVLAATASLGRSIGVALMLILALVLLASILLSDFMSKPLEQLSSALRETGPETGFRELAISSSALVPAEQRLMQDAFNKMIAKLRNSHQQLSSAAYTDPTTRLPNREAFRVMMDIEIRRLSASQNRGALIFIDLENFKEINDTNGHTAGDQVLRFIAARMASVVETATGISPIRIPMPGTEESGKEPPRPLLGRFGGDEFVLFLPEHKDAHLVGEIVDQLLTVVTAPLSTLDNKTRLNAHVGVSHYPDHGVTLQELLKTADIALFHAKQRGQNQILAYDPSIGSQNQAEIRRDVRQAIEKGQMELFYQPKVHAMTNQVHAVEALVRWVHPERGIIPPGEFIPAIEDTDTTTMLGEWVVMRACSDMIYWDALGIKLDVAVNIAARHFISPDFVERIAGVTARMGIDPSRLEIEVTEETALSTHEGAADIINALHRHGFRVSLDDYGRGYSNLTRLSELRVNTIKIDGPLTARLTRDERTRVIFEATINMARGLKCNTVAEGVETAEEVAILTRLGCTELQGFYFSTPKPRDQLASWIEERTASPIREIQEQMAANL